MRKTLFACLGLWLAGAGLAIAQPPDPGRASTASPSWQVIPGTLLWADPEPQRQDNKKWSIRPLFPRKRAAAATEAAPAVTPAAVTKMTPAAVTKVTPAAVAKTPPPAPPAPAAKLPPVAAALSSAPAEAAAPSTAASLPSPVANEVAGKQPACPPLVNWNLQKSSGRWWVSAEYLLRWLKRGPVPEPLLVVGPASANGIAGAPGTTSFGNNSSFLNNGAFSGAHLTVGRQLGNGPFGLELGGFVLEQRTTGQQAGSDFAGNPVVSLPFLNAGTSASDRFLAAFPGSFAGSATVLNSARLWGGEANLSRFVLNQSHLCGQLLAGARYLNLQEQIGMQTISLDIPPNGFGSFNGILLPPRSLVSTADNFSTQNNFYGGQVGGRLEWHYRSFFVQSTAKVALGLSDEIVAINGLSTAMPPGSVPMTALGGLFAQPSNIGRANRSELAFVPDVAMTFGVQLTQRLRVYAGYNFLYWSSVVRPGDQINPVINLAQPPLSSQFGPHPSPTQPLPVFHGSDFWAQGMDLGMAFHF